MLDMSFGATSSRFDAFTGELIKDLDGPEAQAVLDGVALKFCELVVSPPPVGTPVDTGRARAGWARGLEELGGTFTREGTDSKAISEGRRRGGLRREVGKRKGDIGYVAITNNVEYVQYLEYGHSDQAPDGFIRRSLETLRVGARETAKNGIRKILEQSNAAARAAGLKWVDKAVKS